MKQILTLIIAFFTISMVNAQTLFEIKYYDPNDRCQYTGLFVYNNENDCYIRCIDQNNEYWECNYECGFEEDEDLSYMAFFPKKDDGTYPTFLLACSNYGEYEDAMYYYFDEDDDVLEAKSFKEIDIASKDENYFGKFFNDDERMYQQLVSAIKILNNQHSGGYAYNNGGHQSHGGGYNQGGYGHNNGGNNNHGGYNNGGHNNHGGYNNGGYNNHGGYNNGGNNNHGGYNNGGHNNHNGYNNGGNNNHNNYSDDDDENYSDDEDNNEISEPEYDNNTTNNQNVSSDDVTLHFLVVAATKDESIGESVQTDLNLVKKQFSSIANTLGIKYDEKVVSDNNFNKTNVLNAVNNLSAGSNDIIVFVYSGHGFRFDDDTDEYPEMHLTYGDVSGNTYLGVSEVFNKLTQKGARLTICFTDCCNSEIGAKRAQVRSASLLSRSSVNTDVEKLKTLFINNSGTVRATAAKPGQYALCDETGGFLLTSVLSNIQSQVSALSQTAPSWTSILDKASQNVANKTAGDTENGGSQIVVKSVKIK
ncbi:MAG: caspase family protein [Bacteroidales bacterium]|nr:caspase family protein [Bacteroidales bacterium]